MPRSWPALTADHPLAQLHARLPALIDAAGHSTIWAIPLLPPPTASEAPRDFGTLLVLQKFLRSVKGDQDKAAEALLATLKWRKEFGLDKESGDGVAEVDAKDERFKGLGWVTKLRFEGEKGREVVCTVRFSLFA
jgi:hypothetical protein